MEKTLQIEMPLLLPDIPDEKDECVHRLATRIQKQRGIQKAHIDKKDGQLYFCFHYDPDLIPLNDVKRIVEDEGAQLTQRYQHEILWITNMDCADCAASIEHIIGRMPGVIGVAVSYAAEKMHVEYDLSQIKRNQIITKVQQLGYRVSLKTTPRNWLQRNWQLILALFSGLSLATAFAGEKFWGLPAPLAYFIYLVAYFSGGYDAARHGIKALLNKQFEIEFLMVLAALGAAILGHRAEGGLLLFLFSLGHALEHYATDKVRRAIGSLRELTPHTARVHRNHQEVELAVEDLQRGDRVIVLPGERIPVDGQIITGLSALNESVVTGESIPREKGPGDTVFAGTVNGKNPLEIRVTKLAKDTTLAHIVQMVEVAQTQKAPTQRFTEKFERYFVPAVLGFVGLVIVVPPLLGWLSWKTAFIRAMALLVASSPCALVLATPVAVLSAIGRAARNGILIKGGAHLESLGRIKAMAFDKTGTITTGELRVTDLRPIHKTTKKELLQLAAIAESQSSHPIGIAINQAVNAQKITVPAPTKVQSHTGLGTQVEWQGKKLTVGNRRIFADQKLSKELRQQIDELESAGKTAILVQHGQQFRGLLGLADQPRSLAKASLAILKELDLKPLIMITGDNHAVAGTIARQVGFSHYKAELLPEQKVAVIKELRREHKRIAMVGDGVNDAPAMVNATLGIAMGASGTDIALETADVALMADDLSKLPYALKIGQKSRRIIMQNIFFSLGVILVLIPLALLGLAGIGIAIVLHEGSTLLVVGNGLRLMHYKFKK